jgi:hypothetical protein
MPGDPPAVAAVASEAEAKTGAEAKSVLGDVEVLVRRATHQVPLYQRTYSWRNEWWWRCSMPGPE